jgi:hypothetical protein
VKDIRGIQGNAKCCEERHPSSPRMLDRMLGEKQAQQQAADKDALVSLSSTSFLLEEKTCTTIHPRKK